MTDGAMLTIMTAIFDWRCPGHLSGTTALMVCANLAIEYEHRGTPWSTARLAKKCAISRGKEQRAVWESIRYALRSGPGPKSPAKAIKAIVERAHRNGTI